MWNVFTWYSVRGANSKHPEALDSRHFEKINHDCGILDGRRVQNADLAIIMKKWAKADNGHTLLYHDFLSAMRDVSLRCYPDTLTEEAAFHRLLCERVPVSYTHLRAHET